MPTPDVPATLLAPAIGALLDVAQSLGEGLVEKYRIAGTSRRAIEDHLECARSVSDKAQVHRTHPVSSYRRSWST